MPIIAVPQPFVVSGFTRRLLRSIIRRAIEAPQVAWKKLREQIQCVTGFH
jgi:hypothetical protein